MYIYEVKSIGVFSASVTYCMFTHSRDGKEGVVLGVLPHCLRQWLEAKLDTSLVVCLCLYLQSFAEPAKRSWTLCLSPSLPLQLFITQIPLHQALI